MHNYPLQITAALGIPGFLLLYGLFGAVAWFSAPLVFRRADGSISDRVILGGLWAACAGYLVHLVFGLSVTGTTVLLWVLMAAVLAPLARAVDVKAPSWGAAAAVVAAGLAAVLFVMNVVYIRADNHYLRGRVVARGMERVQEAESAIKLNPYNDMYRAEYGMANLEVFMQYASMLASESDPDELTRLRSSAQAQFGVTERAFLDVIEFVPWEYDNYVFLTNLYVAAGDTFRDRMYYEKGVETAVRGIEGQGLEHGPALRMQYARALTALGRLEEARDEIAYAVEMDPRYVDGMVMYAGLSEQLGDPETALELYERVLKRNPEYPRIPEAVERLRTELGVQED